MAAEPPETYLAEITYRPRTNRLGEWLCPGCGGQEFRLMKDPPETAPRARLFTIRCSNCRREAGTGFPC